MRPIRLPEPPNGLSGIPEIFEGGLYGVIKRAVVIGNGFAGSENQSIGLVRALGLSGRQSFYAKRRIQRMASLASSFFAQKIRASRAEDSKEPSSASSTWKQWLKLMHLAGEHGDSAGLSDILEADAKQIANMARETFDKDGPLLVVASGRDTITVASSIKRLAPDNVFVVQIQHPRSDLNRFDLIITPHHDYYPLTPHAQEQIPWFLRRWITPREPPGKNVVLTVGALHQADSAALRSAASVWRDELALLPKPLLVVNVGGPSSNCPYGVDLAKQLASTLQDVLWSCGSVRISFSRRTPEKVSKILVREFSRNHKVYIWDGKGTNPHMGHLAWADAFVITADSVSMLSEACSTGKPVYVIGAEQCTWKFADFQKSLQERGVVRPFTSKVDISSSWSYPPLNDTSEAANRVNMALAERGWNIRT